MTSAQTEIEPATISVIRGNPSAEEVAALISVLLTAAPATPAPAAPARSIWWASGLPGRSRDWRASGLPG